MRERSNITQQNHIMIHLRSISLKEKYAERTDFPFSLGVIKELQELTFTSPITFLVGENGSGKSTLIEGIAAATGLPAIGGDDIHRDTTLHHARTLGSALRLTWNKRTHRGFFLRAEDFFNFVRRLNSTQQELDDMVNEYEQSMSGYGLQLARGAARAQQQQQQHQYNGNMEERSHGESFISLFRSRIVPNGLYIMDEPEAPLSPRRQYAFMFTLAELVRQQSQCIIATHSPILMSFPGAQILSVSGDTIAQSSTDELDHIQFTKTFLNNPQAFVRHLNEVQEE
ncbi:MAG: AAA family ATPase [Candidatus Kapaibacterium sp.]